MAIIHPTEPSDGQQALQGTLQYLLSRTPDAAAGASLDQVQYTQPHQVYTLGVDALAKGLFLDAAEAGPWRYLLVDGTGSSAFAEAQLAPGDDGALAFSGLVYGPTVGGTVDALVDLEQNNQKVRAGDYELRFLQCPAIQFFALWLHGDADDIIRPIPPTPTTVMDSVAMDPTQVQPGLQTAAQNVLAQVGAFPGPSAG